MVAYLLGLDDVLLKHVSTANVKVKVGLPGLDTELAAHVAIRAEVHKRSLLVDNVHTFDLALFEQV